MGNVVRTGQSYRKKTLWIILRFWEIAHLPLAEANINTYFLLRAKCWLRGGVGGQFPRNVTCFVCFMSCSACLCKKCTLLKCQCCI